MKEQDAGNRRGVAIGLSSLGLLAYEQGDLGTARVLLGQGLSVFRSFGDKRNTAAALINLGLVAEYDRDYVLAREAAEECLAISRELGARDLMARALNNLGCIHRERGDFIAAGRLHRDSLKMFQGLGSTRQIADVLGELARLAIVEGEPGRAAHLLAAEEALREHVGTVLHFVERNEHEQTVAAIRSALGDERFTEKWAEGRAMTLEDAISYACNSATLPRGGQAAAG